MSSFYLDGFPSALNHIVGQAVGQSASQPVGDAATEFSLLASQVIKIQVCSQPDS